MLEQRDRAMTSRLACPEASRWATRWRCRLRDEHESLHTSERSTTPAAMLRHQEAAAADGNEVCAALRSDMATELAGCVAQAGWSGKLLLGPGVVLYVGPGSSAGEHAHNAVQFVWAKEGDVIAHLTGREVHAQAFLVPAGLEHSFDASGRAIALLLLERHGRRGASADARAIALLGRNLAPLLADLPFPPPDIEPDAALAWCDALLDRLGARAHGASPLSQASRRAIEHVESNLGGVPRLADAARSIGISTTRLTHLFSREVGIPFRRYVLWARIKRAVEASRRGANATAAAIEAGFSDSAHLSRTFRATLGLPPSLVFPRVEIVGAAWDDRNVQAARRARP